MIVMVHNQQACGTYWKATSFFNFLSSMLSKLNHFMNSSFLFRFHKYVLVKFLTEWLDLKSFGLLDTSFNRESRKQFTALLCEFRVQFEANYSSSSPQLKLSVSVIETAYEKGFPLPTSGIVCEPFLLEMKGFITSRSIFSWGAPKLKLSNSVAKYLNSLRALYLNSCPLELVLVLSQVLNFCPNVECIEVTSIIPAGRIIEEIGKSCPNVTKVSAIGNLGNFEVSTMKQLLSRCTQLKEFSLNRFEGAEYAEMVKLVLTESQSIRCLHVCSTAGGRLPSLTGQTMHPLVSLTSDFFDDDNLHHFLVNGGGKLLEYLDISKCKRVLRSTVLIGVHCPLLVELKLYIFALDTMNADTFANLIVPLVCLRSFHYVCSSYFNGQLYRRGSRLSSSIN